MASSAVRQTHLVGLPRLSIECLQTLSDQMLVEARVPEQYHKPLLPHGRASAARDTQVPAAAVISSMATAASAMSTIDRSLVAAVIPIET